MKKVFFSVLILISCFAIFSGCKKDSSNATTINPYLTANVNSPAVGKFTFTSATVVPSVVDTQTHDTTMALVITGDIANNVTFGDKIVLTVAKYKKTGGVFSIVMGEAGAAYIHAGTPDVATGGVVAITGISANSIIGYFSFTTNSGTSVTNGEFSVGKPY